VRNRILVVEDDESINRVIVKNLTSAGYAVASYLDGAEAAKAVSIDEDFDLALLDVMLPGMDGFELLGYMKHADIPVIYLTAKNDVDSKVRGLRDGAEDYVVKPFEVLELLVRIEKVLERTGKMRQVLEVGDLSIRLLNAPCGKTAWRFPSSPWNTTFW
jgi:DNA-binding response OmpR family regulator